MKIDTDIIEEMLQKSKTDIYHDDYLSECEVEEGSDEEEFIYENFTNINNYIIKRLETRLAFMKQTLKNEISNLHGLQDKFSILVVKHGLVDERSCVWKLDSLDDVFDKLHEYVVGNVGFDYANIIFRNEIKGVGHKFKCTVASDDLIKGIDFVQKKVYDDLWEKVMVIKRKA